MMKEKPRVNEDLTKLPEPVKNLWRLVGTWKARGELRQGGQVMPLEGMYEACYVAGGFGVEARADLNVEGVGRYEDLETFGYDPGANEYHFYAVTNEGHAHDHVGAAAPGDRLAFRYTGMQEGRDYREDISLDLKNEDEMIFSSEEYLGDEQISSFNMVLTR
jgi:hypothetical protein